MAGSFDIVGSDSVDGLWLAEFDIGMN